MTTTEWARTTISVFDRSGDIVANVDFPGETLADQLMAAEAWLGELTLSAYPDFDGVRLFCSWDPPPGTRAMTLSDSLVRLLAAAGGTFWLDAYPPEAAEN